MAELFDVDGNEDDEEKTLNVDVKANDDRIAWCRFLAQSPISSAIVSIESAVISINFSAVFDFWFSLIDSLLTSTFPILLVFQTKWWSIIIDLLLYEKH